MSNEASTGDAKPLAELFRLQAQYCRQLGSPLYGGLLELAAEDIQREGPVRGVVAGHENDPRGSALPLRLMGALHRLVLEGKAPALARHYPSAGGVAPDDAHVAWPAFLGALREHKAEVRASLDFPPQTNETGRAASLLGGLREISRRTEGVPVRLFEIGASAGLNLRVDHLPIGPGELIDTELPPDSPPVHIVERLGADLSPIDPSTTEGRLLLMSYVWPDDMARFERLRVALDVAGRVPAPVVHQSAAAFVDGLRNVDGTTTVLWHSVMWQYLDRDEKARTLEGRDRLAARATASAPFAHLSFEPEGNDFVVRLRMWPADTDEVIGRAPPHGVPVSWEPLTER